MKTFGVLAAVVVLTLTGCGNGDDVDVNPGQGEDTPSDVGENDGGGY